MIDFSPLKEEGKNFWFWYDETLKEPDRDGWCELHLYYDNTHEGAGPFSLEYSDDFMHIEVYRGEIPNREFFVELLKNCEGIKDLKLNV